MKAALAASWKVGFPSIGLPIAIPAVQFPEFRFPTSTSGPGTAASGFE
jgi:hypothetical protein